MRPKKQIGDDELLRKRLELLEEYFSLKDDCSFCGAKITERYKADDHAVTVLAIEWFDERPQLIQKQTIRDLRAAEFPSFELKNPLSRSSAPLALSPEAQKESEEEARSEANLAQKSRALEERRETLERLLREATSAKQRDRITQSMREVDELLKALWEGGLRESGLAPHSEEHQPLPKNNSGEVKTTTTKWSQHERERPGRTTEAACFASYKAPTSTGSPPSSGAWPVSMRPG